jgi:hypothetical protein
MMMDKHFYRCALLLSAVILPVALMACHRVSSPSEAMQLGAGTAGERATLEAVPGSASEPTAIAPAPLDPSVVAATSAVVYPITTPIASPTAPTAAAAALPQTGALVILQPTPDPLPPPPLRAPTAMPALPTLPPPNKDPRGGSLPRRSDTEECGEVWSGTEYVPMECIDPSAHTGNARAAQVVIPYERMRQPPEALPKIVDHRSDGTEGPVRKQGSVPVCTAMAFTAALDHAYARWTGQPGAFSVMQVWARYRTHDEREAVGNNVGALLGSEADWPYDTHEAASFGHCNSRVSTPEKPCDQAPDPEKLRLLDSRAVARITQVETLAANRLDILREKLAGGQDVVIAIRMPTLATAGEPGSRYMVGLAKDPNAKLKGTHQVVLAGYAMTPNGNYYLVHNSFGPKWGDQGYAWLHEDYMRAYSGDSLMVIPDVEPVQVAKLRARARGQLTATCATREAPDSISGMCAGICPDGSPRHNNVCADDASRACPSGMVNLTGECFMAAPRSAGADATSGVSWACGPGGCSYQIPRNRLGCNETECAISCPAPAFRLATLARGLVCVE